MRCGHLGGTSCGDVLRETLYLRRQKAGIIQLLVRHLHFTKSDSNRYLSPVILAVSTTAPNPLQAITALHSRNQQFPPWVDTNFLKYTLIIHPENSPLSDEE